MSRILRIGSQLGAYDPFWVQVRESVHQQAQQQGINLIPIEIADQPAFLTPDEQATWWMNWLPKIWER